MKTKTLLAICMLILTTLLLAVGASQINWHPQTEKTATPSPNTTAHPTPSTVTPTPKPEKIAFQSVSLDSIHVISVQAYSQSGQNITLTQAILKDNNENILVTEDLTDKLLPANGSAIKISINQDTTDLNSGGPYTVTLVTTEGNTFTSPEIYSMAQSYLN